jgi:hypothetical protein
MSQAVVITKGNNNKGLTYSLNPGIRNRRGNNNADVKRQLEELERILEQTVQNHKIPNQINFEDVFGVFKQIQLDVFTQLYNLVSTPKAAPAPSVSTPTPSVSTPAPSTAKEMNQMLLFLVELISIIHSAYILFSLESAELEKKYRDRIDELKACFERVNYDGREIADILKDMKTFTNNVEQLLLDLQKDIENKNSHSTITKVCIGASAVVAFGAGAIAFSTGIFSWATPVCLAGGCSLALSVPAHIKLQNCINDLKRKHNDMKTKTQKMLDIVREKHASLSS